MNDFLHRDRLRSGVWTVWSVMTVFAVGCAGRAPPAPGPREAGSHVSRDADTRDAVIDDGQAPADAASDGGEQMDADSDGGVEDGGATPGVGGCVKHGCAGAVELTAALAHSCARLESGQVVCWGGNTQSELGDGTTDRRSEPVDVTGLVDATHISAGGSHTCAIRASGHVVCWGKNADGELGDGTTTPRSTFVEVTGISDAVGISAGDRSTCACLATGEVYCWGHNGSGRLGDGTTIARSTPVRVSGLDDATQVSAAGGHTCALRSTGEVRCWGDNSAGRLGDSTTVSSTTPVDVKGVNDVVQIAVASLHSCALLTSGHVMCWGLNRDGRTGGLPRPWWDFRAVEVVELPDAVAITAGGGHTCAIRATGLILCWGVNTSGELGFPFPYESSGSPTRVRNIEDGVEVSAGIAHTCARRAAQVVMCWGSNSQGQAAPDYLVGWRFYGARIIYPE